MDVFGQLFVVTVVRLPNALVNAFLPIFKRQ